MKQLFVSLILVWAVNSSAQKNDDSKTFFQSFEKAQNNHDLKAVSDLLLDSPEFLWITKGVAIWGKEAALKKFENLYSGTWLLEPDMTEFKVNTLNSNVRQIFVPIIFTIGEPGQEPKKIKFLMNMVLVKQFHKLKVASILPIQSANQP